MCVLAMLGLLTGPLTPNSKRSATSHENASKVVKALLSTLMKRSATARWQDAERFRRVCVAKGFKRKLKATNFLKASVPPNTSKPPSAPAFST